MATLAIKIDYRDGTSEAAWLYPSVQIAFERRFDRGFLPSIQDARRLRTEWLLFAAHVALGIEDEFDVWTLTVKDVDLGVPDGG